MRYCLPLILILLAAGCATPPDKITFASIAAQNDTLKSNYPQRVVLALDADCDDAGMCTLPEANIQTALDIITTLNTEIERRIDVSNGYVGALTHCEYANAKLDEAISYSDQKADKMELTHLIKQVATGALCAGLLIAK